MLTKTDLVNISCFVVPMEEGIWLRIYLPPRIDGECFAINAKQAYRCKSNQQARVYSGTTNKIKLHLIREMDQIFSPMQKEKGAKIT